MVGIWQPNNSFTFTASIGHWQCDFSDDQLIRIRPVDPTIQHLPELPHHSIWLSHLDNFFKSHGKILPPYTIPKTGTAFQHRVWEYLSRIPAGHTQTYQTIADKLGTWPRPIGQACRVNPFPLIIPCHRVVAKTGLGGYMGPNESGLAIKRQLLALEQEAING